MLPPDVPAAPTAWRWITGPVRAEIDFDGPLDPTVPVTSEQFSGRRTNVLRTSSIVPIDIVYSSPTQIRVQLTTTTPDTGVDFVRYFATGPSPRLVDANGLQVAPFVLT